MVFIYKLATIKTFMQKYCIIAFLVLLACDSEVSKSKCRDLSNLLIFDKTFSTDSSVYLIRYSFDEGAFGSCCNQTSIMKTSDSLCLIEMYNVPSEFKNLKLLSNNTISAEIQLISNLQARTIKASKIDSINGVLLNKKYFNKITYQDSIIRIERLSSPNGKFELVSYEYQSRPFLDDSLLHISVVPKGERIPLYGNLYIIKERLYDQVKKIEWAGEKSIRITINNTPITYRQLQFNEINEPYSYPSLALEIKKETIYK